MNTNIFSWFFNLFNSEYDDKSTYIGLSRLKSPQSLPAEPVRTIKKSRQDIKISDLMRGLD